MNTDNKTADINGGSSAVTIFFCGGKQMSDTLSGLFNSDEARLDNELRMRNSFDLVGRKIRIGSRRAKFYFVDGFCKDEVMEKILTFLMKLTDEQIYECGDARAFADKFITYVETDVTMSASRFAVGVLSGMVGMLVEGYSDLIIIDARTYPVRSVEEPENDKVLRGPHDGFVETLVFNTALIRRRIRDAALTMEIHSAGGKSQTDIVICYMNGTTDEKSLEHVRKLINGVKINSLTMSQQSLLECLVPKQLFNPFPKVRFTERPDAAAASVLEGSIVILIDNSPCAMVIPSGIFDFLQDTNDYYLPSLIGSYLRILRLAVFVSTLLLTPVWLLLIDNPQYIPEWLSFIRIEQANTLPVAAQLLIAELVIDALKIASLNTPNSLSNSFSVVGALVLGEFAVSSGWFVSEVVLYMAFVAITNFAQSSFELGYAFKLLRMMLVILVAVFGIWGLAGGLVLIAALLATTKTVSGKCYLNPLIPFNAKALSSLLIRKPINASKN